MDPLQALLRPLTVLMNRQIAVTTPARELCSELDGGVVAVRVRDTGLAAYFLIHGDGIDLAGASTREPDVVVSGSLLSLARLATPNAAEAIREGNVELSGDARIAQGFQRLLRYAKPDIEEELSAVIGDSAAHGLSQFARQLKEWGSEARATLQQNFAEYLQEESGALPSRADMERFRNDVSVLRDDVARMEARLKRLAASRASDA